MTKHYTSVDEYMADFDGETKVRLEKLRAMIKRLAPDADERISYNIPGYFIGRQMVVYFAGYAKHTSLYPVQAVHEAAMDDFAPYLSGRATLKFPNTKPLPLEVAEKFVTMRLDTLNR